MKCIITLFLVISFLRLFPQSSQELKTLKSLNHPEKQQLEYQYAREFKDEIDIFFSALFLFYKKYISSQDASHCSFTPSCSEYAILAIKKQGFIVGSINFFDRFQRCNSLSPEDYLYDGNIKRLVDPVRDHKYNEL